MKESDKMFDRVWIYSPFLLLPRQGTLTFLLPGQGEIVLGWVTALWPFAVRGQDGQPRPVPPRCSGRPAGEILHSTGGLREAGSGENG